MKNPKGFSLVELLIVVAIILVIAAIAIPNLLRSRMQANEAAAIATVRNINNSQATYISQFGSIGYAPTLAALGPGANCDQNGACLLDNLVGCGAPPCNKSGYSYYLVTPGGVPNAVYTTTATPIGFNNTGGKNICSTEDGVLRLQLNAVASLGAGVTRGVCQDPTQYTSVQ
jgi:type IV pilus assembly protein PilA